MNLNRLGAMLLILLLAEQAKADMVLQLDPHYVQSFDSLLTPLGTLAGNGEGTPVGGYLQVEFRMNLSDTAVGEDFWIAIFDVGVGPGLVAATQWMSPATAQAGGLYPFAPSLGFYDNNGPALGGIKPHWEYANADFGVDPNDLVGIIVEASEEESANRQYGEVTRPGFGNSDGLGHPTLIGTLLLQRTDLSPISITVSPIAGSAWGTYTDNFTGTGNFTTQLSSSFIGGSLSSVPEPSSLLLLLTTASLLMIRGNRRRVV